MRSRRAWARVIICLGLGVLLGCKPDPVTYGPPGTMCDVPCEDDPAKMCGVPCSVVGAAGIGAGTGGGGTGGTAGAGGSGGSGVVSVDVTGTVVQFASAAFDQTAPYTEPITIIAPGFATKEVETTAQSGAFTLLGAASGVQWVLAKDLDGAGGAFSTYAPQTLDDNVSPVVPVLPVDLLTGIGAQLDVPNLLAGQAHVVLEISDDTGTIVQDATVFLSGATIGYDVGPGQYSPNVDGTGTLGLAVALNVPVAASSEVNVTVTINDAPYIVGIQMAPDTVTYARIGIDLTP